MAEDKNLALAKATYETLCQTLNDHEWHYEKDDENFIIECTARGDDLPIELMIQVDVQRMLILLMSRLPFTTAEDKRLEMAIAVSTVNQNMVDGSFDYDVTSGEMFFRMTNSFLDSSIGKDLFTYMLMCSCQTVDEYNDKFLMLAKGMISIEQFLKN